jgi:hypothetical protein
MTVHEVAHGDASRDSRKFILMAEKSVEIRKLAGNSRFGPARANRRAEIRSGFSEPRQHLLIIHQHGGQARRSRGWLF